MQTAYLCTAIGLGIFLQYGGVEAVYGLTTVKQSDAPLDVI